MAKQKKWQPNKVDCYVKWLRLKVSKVYREALQEIRQLQECVRKADEHLKVAGEDYQPFIVSGAPDSTDKHVVRERYLAAEESAKNALEALSRKEEETCRKFDLFQWWDTDDPSITIENAHCLFDDSRLVEVLDPGHGQRMLDPHEEARRAFESGDTWCESQPWKYKLDKDGCLTLKINLNAPIEEIEDAIARTLRFFRQDPPKTRRRPDKNAAALETWDCYDRLRNFQAVSELLRRPVGTVKGQYIRACELIFGQRPTGSIKHRRAGILSDPAGEFQSHHKLCSRCQQAVTADDFCPKFLSFTDQDTRALRERLI